MDILTTYLNVFRYFLINRRKRYEELYTFSIFSKILSNIDLSKLQVTVDSTKKQE